MSEECLRAQKKKKTKPSLSHILRAQKKFEEMSLFEF